MIFGPCELLSEDKQITATLGDYRIELWQQDITRWQAVAINGGYPVATSGFDAETALRKLAGVTGLNPPDLLREFGL